MEWTWSFGLALWGAVVATALGVLRVFEFVRDRPDVKVRGFRGWLRCDGFPELTEFFCFTAVNVGKRPVTMFGVCVEMNDGERVPLPTAAGFRQPLPKML